MTDIVIVTGDGIVNVKQRSEFVNFITKHVTRVVSRFIVVETTATSIPKVETLEDLLCKSQENKGWLSMKKMEIVSAKEFSFLITESGEYKITVFCEETRALMMKISIKKFLGGRVTVIPFSSQKGIKRKLKLFFIIMPVTIFSFYLPSIRLFQNWQRMVFSD